MRVVVHHHTTDAGQFEESKHPRDGGKFSSSPGAGKSTSNAEHGEKASKQAAALRKSKEGSLQAKAHNEALGAWADARKLLDPDKPMSEQSAEYKKAYAKAEDLSTKAEQVRRMPEQEKPGKPGKPDAGKEGTRKPQETRKPAAKGSGRKSGGKGPDLGKETIKGLKQIKKNIEREDPLD